MSSILIVNPRASKVDEQRLAKVTAALPRGVEVIRTERAGDARALARELDRSVDRIYVFSGDGTFNEVLNGVTSSVPLGFLPGGGTSVLARALGLPRDPVAAAHTMAAGRTRRIGLGRVDDRRFGFNAGIGLDAELVRRVDELGRDADGRRPGDRAFARAGLGLLASSRFGLEPVLELVGIGRAAFLFVANCAPYTYAGPVGLRFAPDASFDRGLDLFAPDAVPRVVGLPLIGWWALGRGRRHVRAHDCARVEVRCDRPLPLQVDGEDLGDVTGATFASEPAAVTVLV